MPAEQGLWVLIIHNSTILLGQDGGRMGQIHVITRRCDCGYDLCCKLFEIGWENVNKIVAMGLCRNPYQQFCFVTARTNWHSQKWQDIFLFSNVGEVCILCEVVIFSLRLLVITRQWLFLGEECRVSQWRCLSGLLLQWAADAFSWDTLYNVSEWL